MIMVNKITNKYKTYLRIAFYFIFHDIKNLFTWLMLYSYLRIQCECQSFVRHFSLGCVRFSALTTTQIVGN